MPERTSADSTMRPVLEVQPEVSPVSNPSAYVGVPAAAVVAVAGADSAELFPKRSTAHTA